MKHRLTAAASLCALTLSIAACDDKDNSNEPRPTTSQRSESDPSAPASTPKHTGSIVSTDLYELTVPEGWTDVTEQALTVDQTTSTTLTKGVPYVDTRTIPHMVIYFEPSQWSDLSVAPRGLGSVLEGFQVSDPVDREPSLRTNAQFNSSTVAVATAVIHNGTLFYLQLNHEVGDTKSVADYDHLLESLTWK